jgi:hypothetical protein
MICLYHVYRAFPVGKFLIHVKEFKKLDNKNFGLKKLQKPSGFENVLRNRDFLKIGLSVIFAAPMHVMHVHIKIMYRNAAYCCTDFARHYILYSSSTLDQYPA